MGKYLQERLKLHKMSKKRLVVFALIGIVIGAIGGLTFAKYYANNSNKGVTAAANYYFSSDVLDEALIEGEDEWKIVYNTEAWDGTGNYSFPVKIRNYQNQLLYNSANLNIEYSITFELLDDDGGTYSVTSPTGESKELKKGSPVTYDNLVIEGGSAKANEFKVLFGAPDKEEIDESYRSSKIKVVATITGPDFLKNTETKIGGILQAGIIKADYLLKGEFDFEVSSVDSEWSESGKAIIDAMAAFPYSITYNPGSDIAAHDIKVSWDTSKLQLNYFDENYSYITMDQETNTSYITLNMQPNETKQLIFYRTDEFNLAEIMPYEFLQLIKLEDLDVDETE